MTPAMTLVTTPATTPAQVRKSMEDNGARRGHARQGISSAGTARIGCRARRSASGR
jgi:hypothetical protein